MKVKDRMKAPQTHFFMSNNQHEIQCALVGGRRWIIASSVGRAVELGEPKSFAKAIIKKPALKDWKESMIAKGVALNRDEQMYMIERRVLSASLAAFTVAHMRLSVIQVSVFKFLLEVTNIGFDLPMTECSMYDIVERGTNYGISFDYN